MKISVCVGSSCHLKGSYKIIEKFKECIAANGLEDSVTLQAAFCLGKCTNGVSVKMDDEIVCGVSEENAEAVFNQYVLQKSGR